jgi:uncharacterized protein YbjT (DUF2867 family)
VLNPFARGRRIVVVKILLTGANGYIGLRILLELLAAGHTVHAVVRDRRRLPLEDYEELPGAVQVIEADLLQSAPVFPEQLDAAYFLVHSMGAGGDFEEREQRAARNFRSAIERTACRQVIYLGGLQPGDGALSPHLKSRQRVEQVLADSSVPLTVLRASIIVGSGSASFEIIRDLVEKLPVMITPRWTRNRCQPIAIRNVIGYLTGVLLRPEAMGRIFEIGGPEQLAYEELLRRYARYRGLRRFIVPVPFLSLRLSSLWLFFIANTSFPVARALVDSLMHETICRDDCVRSLVPQTLLSYDEALEKAFARIAQNRVPSHWDDALASGRLSPAQWHSIHVPEHGVLRDRRRVPLDCAASVAIDRIWSLGGDAGWPSMNWAWKVRGALDRLAGGIGIRRGRRDPRHLRAGDALDFWRVVLADRDAGRLILFAEMKLPGEAWLEFQIADAELVQTATFRPRGLLGRLYWYACWPFHAWLFPAMTRALAGTTFPSKLPPDRDLEAAADARDSADG